MKPITESSAQALISLLLDEDLTTASVARRKLIEAGKSVQPYLEIASRCDDAKIRVRVRPVLEEIRLEELESRFAQLPLGKDGEPDLEEGAIAVAEYADPDLDRGAVSRELDRIANLVRREVGLGLGEGIGFDTSANRNGTGVKSDRAEALEALNKVLFRDLSFEGNTADYYDPDNSYIHRVLQRRVGLPITLSVVYLLVGRRLDLPVHGVGMPSHFLVKFEDHPDEIFIDPFNRGMYLTREECLERIGNGSGRFAELFLMRTPNRRILVRMLANLRYSYGRNSKDVRPKHLERFIRVLLTSSSYGA